MWRYQQNVSRVWNKVDVWLSWFLSSFVGSLCRLRNKCMYRRDDLFMRSLEYYFVGDKRVTHSSPNIINDCFNERQFLSSRNWNPTF